MIRSASRIIAKQGQDEDRVKINQIGLSLVAVLADGADSIRGGGKAADIVVERLTQQCPADIGSLFDAILDVDQLVKLNPDAGYSTAIGVCTNGTSFIGAAVGDSEALLIREGELSNLASDKEVEPLIGNGSAFPTMFADTLDNAVLLLCSDGLSKYIALDDVLRICSKPEDLATIINELVDALELPDGVLQDDVSIVVLAV